MKQLRTELTTKDGELAQRKAEDLAVKDLKLCRRKTNNFARTTRC